MAYEYTALSKVNILGPEIIALLNEMGQDDWRFVFAEHGAELSVFYFERKIEVNAKLRAAQLGEEPPKEVLDDGNSETDQD